MEAQTVVAPLATEVAMVEPEVVRQVRELTERGWGAKRIAQELGIARNTVHRYVRNEQAHIQVRPGRRALDDEARSAASELFTSAAQGNAVVVQELLAAQGHEASVRTVQRAVAETRREQRAAAVATIRFETAPGAQMQIDFGEKLVVVGGKLVRVYLLAAVLGYSRRIFVRAFHNQRSDDWREGIAAAFRHFGGVPRAVLGDNAKALVLGRDRDSGLVTFHPRYLAFCKDWDVEPRACAPYRARTKGKVESGVKYVKRNALAGREFASFAALEAHLECWMVKVDGRVHGTTHEAPAERFARDEAQALRSLPARPLPVRDRRLVRRVSHDAFVDVDTVRYSVPHRLVRSRVEVAVGDAEVRIFAGVELIAVHVRSREPHARVAQSAHFGGLYRPTQAPPLESATSIVAPSPLAALGRSLADYQAAMEVAS